MVTMGLNDPLRISSLMSALPTDPDAPRTTAACMCDMMRSFATAVVERERGRQDAEGVDLLPGQTLRPGRGGSASHGRESGFHPRGSRRLLLGGGLVRLGDHVPFAAHIHRQDAVRSLV